jgi:hypothetical protein
LGKADSVSSFTLEIFGLSIMTTDVVQNGKEGEKVNGHEALDLAETVRRVVRYSYLENS